MTLYGAIMELVMMRENPMMPAIFKSSLDKVIETLSEVEPEPHWIPCTPETMPDVDDEVLTTYIVNGNRKKRFVETARWFPDDVDGNWSSPWDEYRVIGTKIEVIAWMPLPSPYQPEEESE